MPDRLLEHVTSRRRALRGRREMMQGETMAYPLEGTCFNCGRKINARTADDGYAIYTSDVEFFSPDGLLTDRSVAKRLVCADCGEFAADHPIRFPAKLKE